MNNVKINLYFLKKENRSAEHLALELVATDALDVREHVPVAGKDEHGDVVADNVGVERQVHDHRIQARPVERARRVRLLGVQGKRVAVDVALGDVGVVLRRLHLAKPLALHGGEARQVVHAQADLDNGVGVDRDDVAEVVHAVQVDEARAGALVDNIERALRLRLKRDVRGEARARAGILAAAGRRADARKVKPLVGRLVGLEARSEDELHDGVVEQKVHRHLGAVAVRRAVDLHGVDELIKETLGEAVALDNVEVHVLRLDARLEIRVGNLATGIRAVLVRLVDLDVRVRHDDQVLELLKVDRELHAVEGKRHERQRVAGHLGVPERQRDIQALRAARVGNELLARLELANHVLHALAGLARQLLEHVQVLGVERVNDVATDNQAHGLEQGVADGVGPVGVVAAERVGQTGLQLRVGHVVTARRGRAVQNVGKGRHVVLHVLGVQTGEVGHHVLTVDQIARAVERDRRRRAAKSDRVGKRLLNRLSGEVRVRGVLKTPVRHGRAARQMKIRGAASDNLRDGATLGGTRSKTRTCHIGLLFLLNENQGRITIGRISKLEVRRITKNFFTF